MSLASLLRSVIVLSAFVACAGVSASHAAGDADSYTWRADLLSPSVRDATGSQSLWQVPDAVASWRELDANIDPVMTTGGRAEIMVVEGGAGRWLVKTEVFVEDGYATRARIVLSLALGRSPYTAEDAKHVLCHEFGYVLGLRGDVCTHSDGSGAISPTAADKAELEKLYGAIASSVSNDSRPPSRGEWITVHAVPR